VFDRAALFTRILLMAGVFLWMSSSATPVYGDRNTLDSIGCTFSPHSTRCTPVRLCLSTTGSAPGNPTLFILRAVQVGTVVLIASARGDVQCDTTSKWWINGSSGPVTVERDSHETYLPVIAKR